jgi:hypothetical protein
VNPLLFTFICLSLAVGTGQAATLAQERRAARQADAALQQQENRLAQAQKNLDDALAARDLATNALQKTLTSTARDQAKKLGMDQAKAERVAALAALNKQREVVMATLKNSSEYQRARKEADEVLAKIATLGSDQALDSTQRQKLVSEQTPLTKRPMELENAALKSDEKMKSAVQRLGAAEQKLATVQKALQKAVDSAPAVVQARGEVTKAEAALKKAQQSAQEAGNGTQTATTNAARATKALDKTKAAKRAR